MMVPWQTKKQLLDDHRALVRTGEKLFDVGLTFQKASLAELQAMRAAYIAKLSKLRTSKAHGYDERNPKGKPVHDEISLIEKLLRHHLDPRLQRLYGDWLIGQVREAFASPAANAST